MKEVVWGPDARELQKLIQDLGHFQLACIVLASPSCRQQDQHSSQKGVSEGEKAGQQFGPTPPSSRVSESPRFPLHTTTRL